MGQTPERFFGKTIFTYGHANVVRAVASGLAQSGSVDGYVYEVLQEVDPDLTNGTRLVRASDWYAFPPIACQASAIGSERTRDLQRALLQMHMDPAGKDLLTLLRLDRFEEAVAPRKDGKGTVDMRRLQDVPASAGDAMGRAATLGWFEIRGRGKGGFSM
jgi:phosphonate transport system substrate-binding protein